MKYSIFIFGLLFLARAGFSQSGPIAHWDMDSTTNDVSGGGHNGHAHNLTPDVGRDGVMGHGYWFNGNDSWITIPYSPSFNLTKYTICATVRVNGFYSAPGHANVILVRGGTGSTGHGTYELIYSDVGNPSSSCDTTLECFWSASCASGSPLGPSTAAAYAYTPHIVGGQWYKIVATFNDTVYKVYIDGVLRATTAITTPGTPMGTSSDSMSIGYSFYDASSGVPYQFRGIIDDIQLFNRVLTDSEATHFGDTCGSILSHPVMAHLPNGGNTTYSVTTSISSPVFQWQVDMGTGFINLSNAGPYSGVTTATLTVTGVTAAMNNYQYRCLVSNGICSDTSHTAALLTGIYELTDQSLINVYPSPAHNILSVDINSPAVNSNLQIYNSYGQLCWSKDLAGKSSLVDISSLSPGMYIVKLLCNGELHCFKITKL